MALSHEQVKHIAKLARLHLLDKEVEKLSTELTDILNFVEQLNEVNTDSVIETKQVTGLENILREDCVKHELADRDALLACTELPVEGKQIKVKSVL